MNDYAARFPVWEHGMLAPGTLPISDDLEADLQEWARVFDAHHDWQQGWDDADVAAQHQSTGYELHRRLQTQLGQGYEVELRMWEHEPPSRSGLGPAL